MDQQKRFKEKKDNLKNELLVEEQNHQAKYA